METRELEHVVYEKEGSIARIILNNPSRANAQTAEMVHSVNAALDDAQYDYSIKVVIIKANGKGFCSGHVPDGSYPEFQAERDASGLVWRSAAQLFLWPVLKLFEFPKPVIAQVHGYAIGGGTTWALLPEITVCSEDAWFQMPLVPGFGLPGCETMFEPWVFMNYKRAAEYLYTAQKISAAEALDFGLVNRVVPADRLEAEVEELAASIARAPLATLQATKMGLVRAWEAMGFRTHQQTSTDLLTVVSGSREFQEYMRALMERGSKPLDRL
ncbi:enoyl-CoA hydratase/isomerase family protein [Mycobacterium intracellulare]|uniref:enoyl-CoA hydratase/isomerase family protein n=1 Tax=Mycobacterium intracellulare TaxID=1767 RepID=UPI000BAC236A|nr:enoyl-CoA hydratase-related protein [Mycobacterium intracellulare]ASW98552.1 enoyl-CoA hydratase [Mycobacterium intracellulare subsp. chimaera]PBA60196.1 enoyl-CoA hydratase [Mycobacterium intracellulare subsp. chimaera]